MRKGWVAGVLMVVACGSATEPPPPPAPAPVPSEPAPAPAPPHTVVLPPRDGEQVVTETKPTAAMVMKMLGLDPEHDKLTPTVHRDVIVWRRTYDGIPVLDVVKTVKAKPGWVTMWRRYDVPPAPARKGELIGPAAAIANAGPMDDPVTELVYRAAFRREEVFGSPTKDGTRYVRMVSSLDLLYVVHRRGWEVPAVLVDAYRGSVVARVLPLI